MTFIEKYSALLVAVFSILLYFIFAYFLERTQFYNLAFLWVSSFTCFYFFIKNKHITFSTLIALALLFRLVFLFATPNLSQDFYRFIWDGRMILNGLNPYLYLPEVLIEQNIYSIEQADELYNGMGVLNGSHFTNYPPLNQLCFFIAALIAPKSIFGSIIVLRIIIIAADIGIIYYGKKLLEALQLPTKNIFWYVLNPFVIIEMTGNLHFESVMLFFLLASIYKLHQKKWIMAAILIACSISIKLIPLLFLPLFYQWFVGKEKNYLKGLLKMIFFLLTTIIFISLLFLPFFSEEFISNYIQSISLWFRDFEFNASFYYLFREIGYLFRGYNEIAIIGKILPIFTIIFLLFIALKRNNKTTQKLLTAMLFCCCFYYFASTTIHPWYIATPLVLAVFTNYRFAVFWSFIVVLSYHAYANNIWKENLLLVFIEYFSLFLFLSIELYQKSKKNKL